MELFDDRVWQMTYGERAAIEGLLTAVRPELAIEIGTAEGASLRTIARHAGEVHSFDMVEPSLPNLGENVRLHTGDSHVLLPELLERLAADRRNVDFALVDGDHSSEGVRRDVEALLGSPAVGTTVIVAHDTGNEVVRAGLDAVPYGAWPKVAYVDLDFVPGYLGDERFPGELWGGLGLVIVRADRAAYNSGPVPGSGLYPSSRVLALARDVLGGVPPAGTSAATQLEELDRRAAELEALQRRLGELEHEVAHHRALVRDLMTSASWRVTVPLRAAKRAAGRRGRSS